MLGGTSGHTGGHPEGEGEAEGEGNPEGEGEAEGEGYPEGEGSQANSTAEGTAESNSTLPEGGYDSTEPESEGEGHGRDKPIGAVVTIVSEQEYLECKASNAHR